MVSFNPENILPEDYYSKNLFGVHVDIAVLKQLMSSKLTKIWEHLVEYNVDPGIVCVSWFLCLFVNTFPVEVSQLF
jgi:hypothetical protein